MNPENELSAVPAVRTVFWDGSNGRKSARHVLTPSGRTVCGIPFPATEIHESNYLPSTCGTCISRAPKHRKTDLEHVAVRGTDGSHTDSMDDSVCPECRIRMIRVGYEQSELPVMITVCSEGHEHETPRKEFRGSRSAVGYCRRCRNRWYWNEE